MQQVLQSLPISDHHALQNALEGLSEDSLEDSGWELLPGLYKYLDTYPRARLLWDLIIDKGNASEICLSLNQILHSDVILQSPSPVFQAYNRAFERLARKPSRLSSIKRDLFRDLRSLLSEQWYDNKAIIQELYRFSEQYLSDRFALELAIDLIPHTDNDPNLIRMISQRLIVKDVITRCLGIRPDAIPSGLCHILLYYMNQASNVLHQDDIPGLGSAFIRLCAVSIRGGQMRVLADLVDIILPILTSWGWRSDQDLSDIPLLMDHLIPLSACHSEISRFPFRILSDICSDQSLIDLAQSSKRSRPHLSSISLRVLKDRLRSDCRELLVSSMRSTVNDIISEYDPDLTFQESDLTVELAHLDVISSSFNIAIYLALSHQIFLDRNVVHSCIGRLSRLLNRLEMESQLIPDLDRLHSGRMQIRLVESVAERFLQIHTGTSVRDLSSTRSEGRQR